MNENVLTPPGRRIVGLLTGCMSGRLHVPPALDGLKVLTDATATE